MINFSGRLGHMFTTIKCNYFLTFKAKFKKSRCWKRSPVGQKSCEY